VKETDEQYWPQAVELGKMILGPVSGQLGTKRLLIVADGALLLVPFSALALATSSDNQNRIEPVPLMLEHDLVSLPSASTLAELRNMTANRKPATNAVAVLADPVYERNDPRLELKTDGTPTSHQTDVDLSLIDTGSGIARLLASAEEAEIVDMVPRSAGLKALGFDANIDTVRSPAIAQYRILHFAAHGVFNNERPELSGIILSLYDKEARPRAGFLRLQEIYNLNLPVELVVLSACDTALGKEIDGEGLIGLTRGFMNAGSSAVVASLWKVDEDATAELMKYFYTGVLKERLAPATALRNAQTKMWQNKRRHPPYYWAAFVLHGEYRSSSVIVPRGLTRAQIAAVLSLAIVLFSTICVLRRRKKLRQTTLS
jgi:CHAT domain-containing protein